MSSPILFGRITSESSRFAWSGAAGILGCSLWCGLRLRLSAASRVEQHERIFVASEVLPPSSTTTSHWPGRACLNRGSHSLCCFHLHNLTCTSRWCSQVTRSIAKLTRAAFLPRPQESADLLHAPLPLQPPQDSSLLEAILAPDKLISSHLALP